MVSDGNIPTLGIAKMSDWIDVRQDVDPVAVGNGTNDDTAAIQAALDRLGGNANDPKVVYFPAGRYRITRTLHLANMQGAMLVGHGRDSVISWDGPAKGVMFRSNGASRSVFKGFVWDGRGIAGVGIDHASRTLYETRILHKHMAFMNFTIAGIRTGHNQKKASAEMMSYNLLFKNNAAGALFMAWNDYNNIFDGCHFEDNGWGIKVEKGNVVVRNSRFERSRKSDLYLSTHSHSVRRVVSSGSRRFVETVRGPTALGMIKLQDVRVNGWTAKDGAMVTSLRGPVLLVDTEFTQVPGIAPPVRLTNPPHMRQSAVIANASAPGALRLIERGPNSQVSKLAHRTGAAVLTSSEHRFLESDVSSPEVVFDVKRDCGARGDQRRDDTIALRRCIKKATAAGAGASLYVPAGTYRVSKTLEISGGTFMMTGDG